MLWKPKEDVPKTDFVQRLHNWTTRKLLDRLLKRWGMIRRCPWCHQCVETDGKHEMRTCEENPLFDTFTCGVCGGESHWEFGPVPLYRGHGKPPEPKQ